MQLLQVLFSLPRDRFHRIAEDLRKASSTFSFPPELLPHSFPFWPLPMSQKVLQNHTMYELKRARQDCIQRANIDIRNKLLKILSIDFTKANKPKEL